MPKRLIYTPSFLLIVIILSTSIYFQVMDGILPCPLCTLQRFAFGLLGLLFLLGIGLHTKRWACLLIDFFMLLASSLGALLAGRQVWLQHFPSAENGECGVSLQYMVQVLPLNEVMQKIIAGSAECTEKGMTFFGLNMAEWSLGFFASFVFLSLYLLLKGVMR